MSSRTTLNISLTRELQQLVTAKVKSGRYTSASEVVREGLRLLDEKDAQREAALEAVRRNVATGLQQLDRGDYVDGEEFFAELLNEPTRSSRAKGRRKRS